MFRSILRSVTFWSFVAVLAILLAVIFIVDWDSFTWLGWLIFSLGLIAPGAGYYLVFFLAKANILWTIVDKGWCKIVLVWGDYGKTIGPGLRWIGLPGTHSLYKRKMTFFKSVTDKDGRAQAEPHDDPDISSFKTTDYPYALPFQDEEDSHGLPLSGTLAVIGVIEDYGKAFFKASDWYSIVNSEVMPCFRNVLAQVSYDDDIVGRNKKEEQELQTFSTRLWERLNNKEGDKDSVLDGLLNLYGIKIKSVQLRNVDPPPDWRATTLAPYKAQREKEAAKHQAEASAILFDDTNQALKTWREAHPNATPDQIREKQEELRQRSLAKTPGYQQVHIKGLENATTAVVGGGTGGTGILVGGSGGGQNQGGGKNRKGKKGGQKPRPPKDDDDDDDDEDELFDLKGGK